MPNSRAGARFTAADGCASIEAMHHYVKGLASTWVLCVFAFCGWNTLAQTNPAVTPAPKKQLRAGASTSNITPWLGLSINGNMHDVKATHVHDELHARCLVLDD